MRGWGRHHFCITMGNRDCREGVGGSLPAKPLWCHGGRHGRAPFLTQLLRCGHQQMPRKASIRCLHNGARPGLWRAGREPGGMHTCPTRKHVLITPVNP